MTETLNRSAEGQVWQQQHEIVPIPNERIRHEVLHYAALCLPDHVHWCGGTREERRVLKYEAAIDAEQAPASQIRCCIDGSKPAGPPTDLLPGGDSASTLRHLFHGSMKGRTMYVLPFIIPIEGTNPAIPGVQLTDSALLACQIEQTFPSGDAAWVRLTTGSPFWLCLHAEGKQVAREDRVRWELPAEKTLWAYGPDYGIHTLRRVICGT